MWTSSASNIFNRDDDNIAPFLSSTLAGPNSLVDERNEGDAKTGLAPGPARSHTF